MNSNQLIALHNEQTGVNTDTRLLHRANSPAPINVGLSACLAGQMVRHNGGHSHSKLCIKTLSRYFNYVTFCPEVAAGFGTPRPAMRLVGDPANPQLRFSSGDSQNLSQQLTDGFSSFLTKLEHLDGYIVMKNSPSCGLTRVKVYRENGHTHQQRVTGLFTRQLIEQYPSLPVEEEGRLHDPRLRENFILRVFAHNNFRREVLAAPSLAALVAFHSSYKYTLLAHNPSAYRELGRLVAKAQKSSLDTTINNYFKRFMLALAKPASRKNHSNALLHILGHLKNAVASPARQHIATTIDQYRIGIIPLITPLTLLKHYIEQVGSSYIQMQRYLQPYPQDLQLANQL